MNCLAGIKERYGVRKPMFSGVLLVRERVRNGMNYFL